MAGSVVRLLAAMEIRMRMIARVFRWGHCLAVRLPAEIADALDLHQGDEVLIRVVCNWADRAVRIENPCRDARAAFLPLRRFRGRLRADFKFDRLEANESCD